MREGEWEGVSRRVIRGDMVVMFDSGLLVNKIKKGGVEPSKCRAEKGVL